MQLDFEVTRFEGGAPDGNRPDERMLTSQCALIYAAARPRGPCG